MKAFMGAAIAALFLSPATRLASSEREGLSAALESRMTELRDKFALARTEVGQERRKQEQNDRALTVDALLGIIREERASRSAIYREAIRALAKYPESRIAIDTILANLDERPSPSPQLSASPLEGYDGAVALIECGVPARRQIMSALRKPQSEHRLHIIAHVLVRLDQEGDGQPNSVELTVSRLTRRIKWINDEPNALEDEVRVGTNNIRRLIDIMLDPMFAVKRIPNAE